MALGFLTKGPVALVLMGIPLLGVLIWNRTLLRVFTLPFHLGIPVFLLITAPWFYLAEQQNAGFIRYFFVNENFLRFLVKNYQRSVWAWSHISVWLCVDCSSCRLCALGFCGAIYVVG